MTHIVVLSDTHVRAGSARRLPDLAYAALDRADLVLHAGDVVSGDFLYELGGFAPVHAVLGNNDVDLIGVLREEERFDVDGVSIAMVHDSGARAGRASRMHRRFPDADVVVFGHSHDPVDELGGWSHAPLASGIAPICSPLRVGEQRLFNPGSPTQRRRQPHHTIGLLRVEDGRVIDHSIVVVDPPS
jgi:putative phosphoesterase